MKVLVANRGEIAIRLFRAARDLDFKSVAVYSEADREALHIEYADEAHLIGAAAPSASYLNITNILQAAKRSGATAVHPGYGFLAENASFARAVMDAGFTWIGPPPASIESMGDKVSARAVALKAGVSSVPGTPEPVTSPAALDEFASTHGWPIAIKAAFGGGGRGFRVVREPGQAADAFEGAVREATAAFGNGAVYLERYLDNPRHIEIQVLGDSHGNIVHLGERECSIQRRHQKLIEESPSVAMTPDLREAMGTAAVSVSKTAGYHSAGTIEFLLEQTDDGPRFWFLEMNTRLQVEHPVTELITGVDLAKQMMLIARGEKLGFTQSDVEIRGHAIECRINAEDPFNNFLPAPGWVGDYAEPSGPGVRVDSGTKAKSEISGNYDSLIAKLICYGATREEAIGRSLRALSEFKISGVRTTIPFHQMALASKWFADGEFSTNTVETSVDLTSIKNPSHEVVDGRPAHSRSVIVEVDGKRLSVGFSERGEGIRRKPKPPDLSRAPGAGAGGETLTAAMQGTIVKTLADVGDKLTAGQAVLVLEAMKMENMVVCHTEGTLAELHVKAGDTVAPGATLAIIES